jgi:hypothetical protein
MRPRRHSSHWLVVVNLALAGVGLGHVAEYLLLAPDNHQRHDLLARTGHHYFPAALGIALFVGFLAVALLFVAGVARGLGWIGPRRLALQRWHVLPAAQVLAFTGLEVTERATAHASFADIGVVLAVGLPIQALVGFLAGRLVAQLEETAEQLGDRIRAATRRAHRPRRATLRPAPLLGVARGPARATVSPRAPPGVVVRA